MDELEPGIRRITFPLPLGIDHVHCYLLRASTGGWILVDTGLGTRDVEERWHGVLAELTEPVEAIAVTHVHPDHVGGARDVAALTGAPVYQGREDHEQCVRAWGTRNPERFARYWLAHGMPESSVEGLLAGSRRLPAAGPLWGHPAPLPRAGRRGGGWGGWP